MSAPPGPTAAPPGTGCAGRRRSPGRSRAAIPVWSPSRSSVPGGRTARRPRSGTSLRQTESLEKALESVGAGKYSWSGPPPYVKPGQSTGTQGGRLLYDTKPLPADQQLPGDHRQVELQRLLQHQPADPVLRRSESPPPRRRTPSSRTSRPAKNFFVVSVHLDERHSGTLSKEKRYDALRRIAGHGRLPQGQGPEQARLPDHLRWRHQLLATKRGSHAPHNYLTSQGFQDAVAAQSTDRRPAIRRSTTGSGR